MAVIMGVAALVALRGLRRGVQEDTAGAVTEREDQLRGQEPEADAYPARW